MHEDARKGNVSYLFDVAGLSPLRWKLSIVSSMAGILFEAIPFISVYFIINHVLQNQQTPELMQSRVFIFWGAFALGALAISTVCTLVGGYHAHKSTFSLILNVRKRILSHLGTLPMGFFSSTSTGEIQKQMEAGMGKIEKLLSHSIPNLIGAAPLVVSLLITLLILNVWLGLALLVPFVTAFLVQSTAFKGRRMRETAVEMSGKLGVMQRHFNEFLRGITVVKIFGQDNKNSQTLEQSVSDYESCMLRFTKRVSMPYSIFKVLMLTALTFVLPAATVLISLYGTELHLVLTILMFMIVTPCLYSPILELMQLGANLQDAAVSVDQIKSLLDQKPMTERSLCMRPKAYDISFCDVSFSYQDASDPRRRWALRNVSWKAEPGTVTALVGPSGSGKTTAAQLLCRFWDVNAGEIRIGGVDIRDMPLTDLMDSVSFVFQDTFLFSKSVFDNIAMSRPVSYVQVEQAARDAMCHDFIQALPRGYETELGDGGVHISGGEAQRIAIARALLKDSPIVVMDEATAFTDADNETLIQQALGRLLKGKTVITIAHRLTTIQKADQILVFRNGQIIQAGRHGDLLNEDGLYQKLWRIQNETRVWSIGTGRGAQS